MYLISLNLKFETKVLDIAYLLMLKLMKEPSFEKKIDKEFVLLYVKILFQQGKCKDAIDFIAKWQGLFIQEVSVDTGKSKKGEDKKGKKDGSEEEKAFENSKLERNKLEVDLYIN